MPRLEQSERMRPHDHPIIEALYANREQLMNMELDPNVIPDYDFLFQALLNKLPYDLTAPGDLEYIWKRVTDALSEIDQRQINNTPDIACAIASSYLLRNRGSFWQGLPRALHELTATSVMNGLNADQLDDLKEINLKLTGIYDCIHLIGVDLYGPGYVKKGTLQTQSQIQIQHKFEETVKLNQPERCFLYGNMCHAFYSGLYTLKSAFDTKLDPKLWVQTRPPGD